MIEEQGIIGHQMRYSETSLIITWLTQHHGLIRTMAKGVLKSKKNPSLDLFYQATFSFRKARTGHLHTLGSVDILNMHSHLRSSYAHFVCASYFFELIRSTVEEEAPVLEVYELMEKALDYLTHHPPTTLLVERFERRLLKLLGYGDLSESKWKSQLGIRPLKSYTLLQKELSHRLFSAEDP